MLTGRCLCDAVQYHIEGRLSPIWFCHCSKCRRRSGSAFSAGAVCHVTKFRWLRGGDAIARFFNAFCRHCGSAVPQPLEGTDLVYVPVGAIDGDPGSRPSHHVFVGSKACWFEITDALPRFEEQASPP